MAYNHNVSMANITNIVEAFNRHGGMHTCDDLMYLIWIDATPAQIDRKINAPRNVALRTLEYARKQVRQEIRRTLCNHFNDVEESPYEIYRATAHGDAERFWIAEPQTFSVEVSGDRSALQVIVSDFDGDTLSETHRSTTVMEALLNAQDQIRTEFVGRENTPAVRQELNDRIESVILELGASNGQ